MLLGVSHYLKFTKLMLTDGLVTVITESCSDRCHHRSVQKL